MLRAEVSKVYKEKEVYIIARTTRDIAPCNTCQGIWLVAVIGIYGEVNARKGNSFVAIM